MNQNEKDYHNPKDLHVGKSQMSGIYCPAEDVKRLLSTEYGCRNEEAFSLAWNTDRISCFWPINFISSMTSYRMVLDPETIVRSPKDELDRRIEEVGSYLLNQLQTIFHPETLSIIKSIYIDQTKVFGDYDGSFYQWMVDIAKELAEAPTCTMHSAVGKLQKVLIEAYVKLNRDCYPSSLYTIIGIPSTVYDVKSLYQFTDDLNHKAMTEIGLNLLGHITGLTVIPNIKDSDNVIDHVKQIAKSLDDEMHQCQEYGRMSLRAYDQYQIEAETFAFYRTHCCPNGSNLLYWKFREK